MSAPRLSAGEFVFSPRSLRFASDIVTRWDDEAGELVTTTDLLGSKTREVIKIRAQLQEDIIRAAVVIELERLGYTITSPEA